MLDSPFSCQEIKLAVWECGGSKASGLDAFTFKFIKHHWNTIGLDFFNKVMRFESDSFIPKGCNSLFIALVPKLNDPLHIKDYRPISLIGFQYKVIAKVLANRLQKVVRNCIHGCLSSAYGSVLVNGSLTSLHVTLQEAKSKQLFEGVKVGYNKVDVSHLQFADDALIMGKWSLENAKNLFNFDETTTLASNLNCEPSNLPFIYLGLPIGANMRIYYFSLFKAPKSVITYLENLRRNFFWGGTLDCNKLSWIAWNKVCSSSSVGGLGIVSLQASNLALLLKWFWRFHIENDSFWKIIIISIHGMHGNFASYGIPLPSTSSTFISPWKSMAKLGNHLSCANIDFCSLFVKKIVDGLTSYHWAWMRDVRNGPELSQLNGLLHLLASYAPTTDHDVWEFSFSSSKQYIVSSMRNLIDTSLLNTLGNKVR
ncbi:hypothetical protein Tco_0762169 [Tanacetum coccineum]